MTNIRSSRGIEMVCIILILECLAVSLGQAMEGTINTSQTQASVALSFEERDKSPISAANVFNLDMSNNLGSAQDSCWEKPLEIWVKILQCLPFTAHRQLSLTSKQGYNKIQEYYELLLKDLHTLPRNKIEGRLAPISHALNDSIGKNAWVYHAYYGPNELAYLEKISQLILKLQRTEWSKDLHAFSKKLKKELESFRVRSKRSAKVRISAYDPQKDYSAKAQDPATISLYNGDLGYHYTQQGNLVSDYQTGPFDPEGWVFLEAYDWENYTHYAQKLPDYIKKLIELKEPELQSLRRYSKSLLKAWLWYTWKLASVIPGIVHPFEGYEGLPELCKRGINAGWEGRRADFKVLNIWGIDSVYEPSLKNFHLPLLYHLPYLGWDKNSTWTRATRHMLHQLTPFAGMLCQTREQTPEDITMVAVFQAIAGWLAHEALLPEAYEAPALGYLLTKWPGITRESAQSGVARESRISYLPIELWQDFKSLTPLQTQDLRIPRSCEGKVLYPEQLIYDEDFPLTAGHNHPRNKVFLLSLKTTPWALISHAYWKGREPSTLTQTNHFYTPFIKKTLFKKKIWWRSPEEAEQVPLKAYMSLQTAQAFNPYTVLSWEEDDDLDYDTPHLDQNFFVKLECFSKSYKASNGVPVGLRQIVVPLSVAERLPPGRSTILAQLTRLAWLDQLEVQLAPWWRQMFEPLIGAYIKNAFAHTCVKGEVDIPQELDLSSLSWVTPDYTKLYKVDPQQFSVCIEDSADEEVINALAQKGILQKEPDCRYIHGDCSQCTKTQLHLGCPTTFLLQDVKEIQKGDINKILSSLKIPNLIELAHYLYTLNQGEGLLFKDVADFYYPLHTGLWWGIAEKIHDFHKDQLDLKLLALFKNLSFYTGFEAWEEIKLPFPPYKVIEKDRERRYEKGTFNPQLNEKKLFSTWWKELPDREPPSGKELKESAKDQPLADTQPRPKTTEYRYEDIVYAWRQLYKTDELEGPLKGTINTVLYQVLGKSADERQAAELLFKLGQTVLTIVHIIEHTTNGWSGSPELIGQYLKQHVGVEVPEDMLLWMLISARPDVYWRHVLAKQNKLPKTPPIKPAKPVAENNTHPEAKKKITKSPPLCGECYCRLPQLIIMGGAGVVILAILIKKIHNQKHQAQPKEGAIPNKKVKSRIEGLASMPEVIIQISAPIHGSPPACPRGDGEAHHR